MKTITILVCGGRDYDPIKVINWFDRYAYRAIKGYLGIPHFMVEKIVHGNARGADSGAKLWATSKAIPQKGYPANWREYGDAAGPIRNTEMLENERISIGIAFPGNNGTADMVRKLKKAGIPVLEITDHG